MIPGLFVAVVAVVLVAASALDAHRKKTAQRAASKEQS